MNRLVDFRPPEAGGCRHCPWAWDASVRGDLITHCLEIRPWVGSLESVELGPIPGQRPRSTSRLGSWGTHQERDVPYPVNDLPAGRRRSAGFAQPDLLEGTEKLR